MNFLTAVQSGTMTQIINDNVLKGLIDMARLNTRNSGIRNGLGPVRTTDEAVLTFEKGVGHKRDARSELLITAVSTLNENTFYEDSDARLDRIEQLVTEVASDADWIEGLVSWLRHEVGLRAVPAIIAVDAVHARLAAGQNGRNREIIRAAVGRVDETSDILAFWMSRFGRKIPSSVKRGISDALNDRLNEGSLLKWRGRAAAGSVSLRDVLNITRARPKDAHQSALYSAVIENAYGREADTSILPVVKARQDFLKLSEDEKIRLLSSDEAENLIRDARLTHEVIAGTIGKIPASVWERLVPHLGYTALRMNLRRIADAGVSDELIGRINSILADKDKVAESRTMPISFLSARRNAPDAFAWALEKGADGALTNVPELSGRTLILVDNSFSMSSRLSEHSTLSCSDAANIFGAALALRAENPTLVSFNTVSKKIRIRTHDLLRLADSMPSPDGGTDTPRAVSEWYDGHDRVIVITDEQYSWSWWSDSDSGHDVFRSVPRNVPTFTWNLCGYETAQSKSGPGRFTFGGLTDKGFQLIPLIEKGFDAGWPWEK